MPVYILWPFSFALGIGCMAILFWLIFLDFPFPTSFLIIFLFVPFLQFAMTPMFRLLGVYKYLSPMLLVFGANDKSYDIHSGTSFDYFCWLKWEDRGQVAREKIWGFFLEGLLAIAEEVENGKRPASLVVSGTSYFFSENTAKRLGLRLEKPEAFYRLNLYFNFIDLFWMYSFAWGRWRIPKLSEAKKAVITGEELLKQKPHLEKILARLRRNQD